MVTQRDMQVLLCLARYRLLNRRQLQRLCYPTDKDGRITRRRLASLAEEGLIRRHGMLVASQYDGPPSPVYLLAEGGREYLAEELADDRLLLKPVQLPHALHLYHQLAVSEAHMTLEAAIVAQDTVTLEAWYNEAEVINTHEPDPGKHFSLFTEFRSCPRLVCSPDAAFMLGYEGHRSVFYVELDRGTGDRGTGARQLAAQKSPGYAELARRQLHRKHFPAVTDAGFTVLLIARHPQRRDSLRWAFRRKHPGAHRTDLWRFASQTDLNTETFFHGDIFYHCDEQPPAPLVWR